MATGTAAGECTSQLRSTPPAACPHIESFLIKSSSGMDRMITPSKPHSRWLTTHGVHMTPAHTQNGNLGKMGPTPLFFPPKVCCQRTASNRSLYHHTDPPAQPPAQLQQHNAWTHSRSCWTSQLPYRLVPPPEETSGIIGRLEEVYIYGSWFQVQTPGIGIFLFYFIFLKEKSIYNFFFFSSSNTLIIILSFFLSALSVYHGSLSVLPQRHLTTLSDSTLTTKTKTKIIKKA